MNVKITLFVGALLVVAGGALGQNMMNGAAMMGNSASRPGTGQTAAQVVKVPALAGKALAGEAAFNANCAACHGENAAGRQGVAPSFVSDAFKPSRRADSAFFVAAHNGVRSQNAQFGDMPPVQGITDSQITLIVAYIRTLQKANGIF